MIISQSSAHVRRLHTGTLHCEESCLVKVEILSILADEGATAISATVRSISATIAMWNKENRVTRPGFLL